MRLGLDVFISGGMDMEISQYKILGGIKEYQSQFNKKKIYPGLAELIDLHAALEKIFENKSKLDGFFPKEIVDYDLKNKKIVFELVEKSASDVNLSFELMSWALPVLRNEIEEAAVIYDFVEENLKIASVGVVPLNKDEGYFLVPNNKNGNIQIHRYESSAFYSGNQKYRSLKTKLLDKVEKRTSKTPESIKLDLIRQYKDFPNPATYVCETDLDFPFNETIFPVAKRKLIGLVSS